MEIRNDAGGPAGPDEAAPRPRPAGRVAGAVAGLLGAGAALGVGELVTGLVRGTERPVVSVGGWVVDHTPAAVKSFAIRTFGENDKDALLAGTTVILLLAAAGIGVVARRRRWAGVLGVAAFALAGAAAAGSRPGAQARDLLPSGLGAVAAAGALELLLHRRSRLRREPAVAHAVRVTAPLDRRGFLTASALVAGGAAAAGGVGRALRARFVVAAARARVLLPSPRSAAAARPADADLGVRGVTSFMTPNADFYRVDTALVVPQVAPDSWRLRIHGRVARELTFTYDELLARPLVERDITLVCVSNEVGGPYAGTARWLGVPLRELLEEAGADPAADQLVSRSVDGWTAGTPIAAVRDGRDALVAVGMNGEPLPLDHGFPARLVVPGLYGYTSATKWLRELEVTSFDAFDAYWVRRGWAQVAPVKTMTRIDTPRGLASVPAGPTMIGGVAWAIHRGVERVEVRVDDGPWREATLGGVPSKDTWRQWALPWDATPGSHTISARSYDGDGVLQTEARAEPIPDGASGWHSIVALVKA